MKGRQVKAISYGILGNFIFENLDCFGEKHYRDIANIGYVS